MDLKGVAIQFVTRLSHTVSYGITPPSRHFVVAWWTEVSVSIFLPVESIRWGYKNGTAAPLGDRAMPRATAQNTVTGALREVCLAVPWSQHSQGWQVLLADEDRLVMEGNLARSHQICPPKCHHLLLEKSDIFSKVHPKIPPPLCSPPWLPQSKLFTPFTLFSAMIVTINNCYYHMNVKYLLTLCISNIQFPWA